MNFLAAVKGIAPAGGIRPASHITASFVSATKAKPAAHYFGRVPKAADITSVRLGSARCGIAQPCLTLSANASAFLHAQHGPESTGFAHGTPWECGAILFGQRSKRGAPYGVSCGRERDTAYRPVSAYNTAPHYPRHHGNPCAEKVSAHRFRQSSAPVGHRQGTLTITGSNVRLGTAMPVALSLF
jgi:hypothetical protein